MRAAVPFFLKCRLLRMASQHVFVCGLTPHASGRRNKYKKLTAKEATYGQSYPVPIFWQLIYFSSIIFFTQISQFSFSLTPYFTNRNSHMSISPYLSNTVHIPNHKNYQKPPIKAVNAVQTSRTPQFKTDKTDKTVKTTQIHITHIDIASYPACSTPS